jgi:uncharacterized protein YcfL
MRSMATHPAAAFPILLLVLAPALAGCSSPSKNDDLPTEPAARATVLGERLALRDPQTGTENGESFLELTLTNPSGDRIACRCTPEWYDAKGQPIAAAAAWRAVDLPPGKEARLRFAPMPAAARSWRLQFEG